MNLCRFLNSKNEARVGLISSGDVLADLTAAGIGSMRELFLEDNFVSKLAGLSAGSVPVQKLSEITLLPPVESQEIWAAGVTYLRSKKARMEESDFSATAYDKVYEAERPEIFFKSMPDKVVGSGDAVGIRRDAKWNVPEPELALVINARAEIVGYTICNDMSSRDIEGENLLYLPQAKIYERSCAIGPWITVGASEEEARRWTIAIQILRDEKAVFSGETSVSQIKRRFADLVQFLFRSQKFPHGAILSTGTGIVPADDFTLLPGDGVKIHISGIGVLENRVITV